jgi:hypothetical protein
MRLPRVRIQTLMLLMVIVALSIALVIEKVRSARREAELAEAALRQMRSEEWSRWSLGTETAVSLSRHGGR